MPFIQSAIRHKPGERRTPARRSPNRRRLAALKARARAEIRRPVPDKNNPEIKEGQYRVEGNLLRVEDKQGRSLGTAVLRPGDDIEAAARKILRESQGRHGAFHDRRER